MYRCNSILSTSIVVICFCSLASIGCNQKPSSTSAEAKSARPDPAEGFAEIVKVFADGMDAPGGEASAFVASGANASTRFQVHNTVTSKLTAPTNADDPYRGTITVSSQSIYSLRRAPGDDDDKKANDDREPQSRNGFGPAEDESNSDSGFQSFDQGLVSGEKDKVDRNYDLVYNGGRWELVTKLDPKTERSVANAFERALRLQP